ncbi:MAG TPA: ATP-dependent helicase HrpB [Acidiferrobacter sp.]|nr:ATP-dependent helicase HrpB [Acidiferrobacter sp.]
MMEALPITERLADIDAALSQHTLVLLSAQTGSGKTTLVPPALLGASWLRGRKIIMLEPRRLAARFACEWMARSRGEPVGETIGYRTGQETRVSPATRIEIMTEGVLTRRLQRDPELNDVGLIIFDEVHERHLTTDLGLALVQDVQASIRPDMRVLLMSATLERDAFARHFGPVPLIEARGRQYPVDTVHLTKPPTGYLDTQVRAAVLTVLSRTTGDVLVFLPGIGEILRCERALLGDAQAAGFLILRLHGSMSPSDQDEVLMQVEARRVILATAVAQSSVTIPTVDGVVDTGLMRVARFDKGSGFTRLVTLAATQDIADQRAGRAGRVRPGYCLRLWTENDHRGRPRFASPEIEHADLGQLALDLAAWGTPDGTALPWLTPPPGPALAESQRLLITLDLLTRKHELTSAGRMAVDWGLPPRLAAIVIRAEAAQRPLACAVATLLGERDPVRDPDDCGLESRLRWLREHPRSFLGDSLVKLARRCGAAPWRGESEGDDDALAGLLMFAFRDRIAVRVVSEDRIFKLASGQRAGLSVRDPLSRAPVLIALAVEETATGAWIRLAVPVPGPAWARIIAAFGEERLTVRWSERDHTLSARKERYLGEILLQSVPTSAPAVADLRGPLGDAVRRFGLAAVPWTDEARFLRLRIARLGEWQPEEHWPDVTDVALIESADQWLGPALDALAPKASVGALDLAIGLRYGVLSAAQRGAVDRHAPPGLRLRSGRVRALRYQDTGPPILAAPIQEFFGMTQLPSIANGRVVPIAELLSPAGRPLQTTSDISRFWQTVYPELRRSLAARYPRHEWPLDPLAPLPPRRRRS